MHAEAHFFLLDAFRDRIDQASVTTLLQFDLDYTLQHWREPCFDLREEGHHYHTRLVQYAALADGSAWMEAAGDVTRAQAYRAAAQEIRQRLDAHFDPDEGVYVCRFANAANRQNAAPARLLDMAVPLGVIHAARAEGPHSGPRSEGACHAGAARAAFCKRISDQPGACVRLRSCDGPLCRRFILQRRSLLFFNARSGTVLLSLRGSNRQRGNDSGFATKPDYFGLYARHAPAALAAASVEPPFRERLFEAFLDRGDMFMAMVRAHTPASGELSEQFDQTTGAQTSATNLAWSYAAFVAAFASRRAARRLMAC